MAAPEADTDLPRIAMAAAYQAELLERCNQLIRHTTYRPVRAYQALGRRKPEDAVAYIAELVVSGTTEGLLRLAEIGRIAESFEASTLDPRWFRLFSFDTRGVARDRLRQVALTHPPVAVEVAQLLAAERLQFDLESAFKLASIPYDQAVHTL